MQKLPPEYLTRLIVSSAPKLTSTLFLHSNKTGLTFSTDTMLLAGIDKVDIVKSSWIVDSITRKTMQQLSEEYVALSLILRDEFADFIRSYLLHATAETKSLDGYTRTRDEQSILREERAQKAMDAESDDTEEENDEDYISSGNEQEDINDNEYGIAELQISGEPVLSVMDEEYDSDDYVTVAAPPRPSVPAAVETQEDSMIIIEEEPDTEDDVMPPTKGMGGDTEEMEYDPEVLFSQLVFYLDTGANALSNKLIPAKYKALQAIADAEYAFLR